jgi:sugar-specific transcriptional regulator TrmB
LSEGTIKKVLNEFGLTEREAEVYIFLAKHGVQKGGEIAKQTKIPKALVYHILKSLERKGVVESTLEFPARFAAVPFEAVLEMNIRAKREEAALIEKRKISLLEDWKNISKMGLEPELARFVVIEGTRKIYLKIAEIIENTKNSLSAASTVADLLRFEQHGVIDSINANPMKSKVKFRFLTELSRQNLKAIKLLRAELNTGLDLKARNPDLGLALFPRMVIRDDEEILFFISPRTLQPTKKQEACIYTNCESLVQAFASVFEDLWHNSTDIENKIVEIETGKPTPKTLIIADAETAEEKYSQTLRAAESEIMLMTSAKGLVQLSESAFPFEEFAKRNVSVKIMAPITIENMEQAKLLSKTCEVRHVASSYLGTTIVDGKHLFQLKASLSDQDGSGNMFSFKNAFYTTDSDYVEKMKNMLEDVWKRAYDPTKTTMPPLMRLQASSKKGLYTKRDLRKLPKRLLSAAKAHGQIASGIGGEIIIEPPSYLNMPTLRISPNHFEHARSKRGSDLLRVDLWLKTTQGEGFVPVAIVTDAIPEMFELSKIQFAGTLAGENHISVKPEELQVWNRGKTLFAGWTIPIPLLASKYVLEPACIIFEAYGDEIHSTHSLPLPSGYLMGLEWDGFQAFTTYIGPSWKYSGPGIYGSVGNFLLIVAKPEPTNIRTA